MEKIIHKSSHIPAAGPYSVAVEAGGFIFISGQLGINSQTAEIIAEINAATHQVLRNIETILSSVGLKMENIVKTTIYLKNIHDFPAVNKIYSEYFPHEPPARSTVVVSNLPKGALLEIDAVAVR